MDAQRARRQPAHVEQVRDEGGEPVGLLVDRHAELADAPRGSTRTSSASSDVTDALIEASGVRRSCDTAASNAERSSLTLDSSAAVGCLSAELAGSATAALELVGERVHDVAVLGRDVSGPREREHDTVAEVDRLRRRRSDRRADRCLPPPRCVQPSGVLREHRDGIEREARREGARRRCRADPRTPSPPRAARASRPRHARERLRQIAGRPSRRTTTRRSRPITKTTSETTLSRSLIVQLCSGGKKNQLAYSDEVMAVTNAGPVPPSAAAPTTTSRKSSNIDGRPMWSRTGLSSEREERRARDRPAPMRAGGAGAAAKPVAVRECGNETRPFVVGLRGADDVDVDRTRRADDPVHDRARRDLGPTRPPRRADHELRRLLCPGGVEESERDVATRGLDVAAAQLRQQRRGARRADPRTGRARRPRRGCEHPRGRPLRGSRCVPPAAPGGRLPALR